MRIPLPLLAPALGVIASQTFARTVLPSAGLIDITTISEPRKAFSRARAEGAIRLFKACVAPAMATGEVRAR